jgi:hypothetical protein
LASSKLARPFRSARGEPPIRDAIEVTAMLGDSVLGLKHCVDPRGGRLTRATWAVAAGGLACLLASAIAFFVSVRTAASDAAALERHTGVLNRAAYAFRPHRASDLAGGVVLGGLVLGLSALALAHLRAGGERESPLYRVGTAPGVEQPLEGAPSERFPLVAPSGDDFVFNYAPGIEGELIAGGATTSLSELAAAGLARPSAAAPGAIEIPIPVASQIRARVAGVTFLVSSVARPEPQVAPPPASALDPRAMWYLAGSLAVHLGFVHLLDQVDLDEVDPDGGFTCHFGPIEPSEPPEPEEEICQPIEGSCRCVTGESPRWREEVIERAREVALTGGILGRTLLWDVAPELDPANLSVGIGFPVGGVRAELERSYLRSVDGDALDSAVIKRRIQRHEPRIGDCYHRALLARPGLGGAVSVRFLIGPAGDVQRSIGEGFDATVASCVAAVIERIAFPASRNARPSRVTSSFEFRPAGRP